jgi:MinD-like ATPase involved in chromosome partitioning or flagellar assembly
LRALGVQHLVPAHADAAAVANIIVTASDLHAQPVKESAREDPPPTQARGTTIAVWGPAGAPGRTTVAVNLAAELGARASTILVDADTYGGAVAQALGLLDEAPGLAALARASLHGSLSAESVGRHALMVSPGLRVLTGITRSERWGELTGPALEPIWELLRAQAQYVVIDVGFCLERDEELQYDTRAPQRNGATLSALAASDLVVAVGSAEPLSMQRLVHGLAALDGVAPGTSTARMVVVNRVRATVAGARPREAVADALARYSGVERVWTVPFDAKGCDAATLAGQSLSERAPHSPARRAIVSIADTVLAGAAATPSADVATITPALARAAR